MMVDEKKTQLRSEYDGKSFFFCSAYCKKSFDQSPGKYGRAAKAEDEEETGNRPERI